MSARGTTPWRALLAAASLLLFAVAVSNASYELTSPSTFSFHVVVRKAYAVGAFAIVGFLCSASEIPALRGVLRVAAAVALYSAVIEVGQYAIGGSREGFAWNAIDVASGALGGAIGGWACAAARARAAPTSGEGRAAGRGRSERPESS